uniref:Uncharacterized protein n=1 Tax=Compsopogon caeruleus TaxID=31354 RepID=A0A7S1TB02_9RHOD|mmetsp:Transcript_15282/g.31072  ORF Transcript_15282/g.31072 Transcript_15282/m.31072 type:complete len:128 (+) Transcript_15282:1081-1464(+)
MSTEFIALYNSYACLRSSDDVICPVFNSWSSNSQTKPQGVGAEIAFHHPVLGHPENSILLDSSIFLSDLSSLKNQLTKKLKLSVWIMKNFLHPEPPRQATLSLVQRDRNEESSTIVFHDAVPGIFFF